MQPIMCFNDKQKQDFKSICADLDGPTSTWYVLDVLLRSVYALKPDIDRDTNAFGDSELLEEFSTCMAAHEYGCMRMVINGE